ncbi:hypothetical protein DSM112329_01046 [Paraconexibacter sp. AEG42_29]|uniref:Uncharacterized protein n=1 Tax=Paraconexibacter sp. AEG42_29 TaxID=2997339 RepID=A0AAU7ARF1_9ACTN
MSKNENPEGRRSLRARLSGQSVRTRSVIAATGILVVGVTATGVAATGGPLLEGKRNGTATVETQVIADINATNSPTGGYSTRQSNLSTSGGGAVYGCRSTSGGSAAVPPTNPCLRGNNLSTGYAFEFNSSAGTSVGSITAGAGGDTKKPFTTNATGVATGLNADRVDGANASDIVTTATTVAAADATKKVDASKTRWLLLNEKGEIEEQSGGFTVIDAYKTNQNAYISAGSSVVNNGFSATIAIQNQVDVDGAAGADPNFGGEVSVSRCNPATVVVCAPADAKNDNAFVVSPRNSDGSATTATSRKRVYITVTP